MCKFALSWKLWKKDRLFLWVIHQWVWQLLLYHSVELFLSVLLMQSPCYHNWGLGTTLCGVKNIIVSTQVVPKLSVILPEAMMKNQIFSNDINSDDEIDELLKATSEKELSKVTYVFLPMDKPVVIDMDNTSLCKIDYTVHHTSQIKSC